MPVQILPWLGNTWDLVKFVVYARQHRLECILELLNSMDTEGDIEVRRVAKVTGSLISLELAYGDVVHIQTKAMQMMVAACDDWYGTIAWSAPVKQEVLF